MNAAARSCLLLVVASVVFAAEPKISKVEPPDWWVGHSINPVRLLIHGEDLTGAAITGAGGLKVSRVRVNEAGTYVFADIEIPSGQQPGDSPLTLKTAGGTASVPFRVNAALPKKSGLGGFTSSDVVYLLMPDRFADGNPANDDLPDSPGLFNRANPFFYHGGDFQGVIDHLPYLKDLGVTALWMTPVYTNSNHADSTSQANTRTDYHGYGAVDYYGVNEHFGDMALLQKLVRDAHSLGIKVIQDQVENHVGPHHSWVKDPPTPTWFHGTLAEHIKETWQIWAIADPDATTEIRRDVTDGWFGGFLPDMNQEDAEVRQYEIQDTLWWIGKVGFDAVRQDTWPYVPRQFWHDWMTAIKRQFPTVDVVGEVMDGDPATVSFFQGGRKRDGVDTLVDSLFDYPIYYKLREVFGQGKQLIEIPKAIAHDFLYPNPGLLWTVAGDHDVARFMNDPQATAASFKLALTTLFTIRGVPVLYYGDEIGMKGGDDPDNRHDFPGGWPGDQANAFSSAGRTAEQNDLFNHVQRLTHLRASSLALARGETHNLVLEDQHWVYSRRFGKQTAIIAINNERSPATIKVPVEESATWRGMLGVVASGVSQSGGMELTLPAQSAEVFLSGQQF